MSFIAFIKDKFKSTPLVPDMVHPVFGDLMSEVCGDSDDFWQSQTVFIPLSTEICINIYAGAEGPCKDQVKFYNLFVTDYENEFNFVAPFIIKEFEDMFQVDLAGNFVDNFQFVSISIPINGDRNGSWDLSFDCLADKNRHMFTAEIEGGTVTHVRADG